MFKNISQISVSICIPTYNRPKFLMIAVESVLAQNFDDYEIIITDNSDNNKTKKMIEKLNHPKIKYYKNEQNLGMAGNWNRCLEYANGKYIKLLMDDDILLPGCIEYSIQPFLNDKDNEIGLVCNNYYTINKKGKEIKSLRFNRKSFRLFNENKIENGQDFIINYLLYKRRVGLPTAIFFKRDIIDEIGYFNESFGSAIDIEYWCRICSKYNFYYLNEILCAQRQHGYNLLKKLSKKPFYYKKIIALYEKLISYVEEDKIKQYNDSVYFILFFNIIRYTFFQKKLEVKELADNCKPIFKKMQNKIYKTILFIIFILRYRILLR